MSDSECYSDSENFSSYVYPMKAGSVKKNSYAILKGFPCKVTEMVTQKTGKHGHAKAIIIGTDIFTGKKHEDSCPTSHNMEIPFVKKIEYKLIGIDADNQLTLLHQNGETNDNLIVPKDMGLQSDKIRGDLESGKNYLFTVISAMGQEKIISFRESASDKY